MGQLTYKDEEGNEVKTALFLRNRGSCCKTACRHCPYGFTLRKKGLQFADYSSDAESRALAEQFVGEQVEGGASDVVAGLLAEGLGARSSPFPWTTTPGVPEICHAQGQGHRTGGSRGHSGQKALFGRALPGAGNRRSRRRILLFLKILHIAFFHHPLTLMTKVILSPY